MTWTLLICIAADHRRAELVSGGRLFDVGQFRNPSGAILQ